MADWKIINGNLPFKDDFAERPTNFDGYPDWLWRKTASGLPYKVMFPVIHAIDDTPAALWRIVNGNLPFKSVFPTMYGTEGRSNLFIGSKKATTFYISDDKVLAIYLGDTKVMG